MSAVKQVDRGEMERLLAKHFPDASPLVRHAALTGSPITIDGVSYAAPDTFDPKELHPCRVPALITKVGKEWINN